MQLLSSSSAPISSTGGPPSAAGAAFDRSLPATLGGIGLLLAWTVLVIVMLSPA